MLPADDRLAADVDGAEFVCHVERHGERGFVRDHEDDVPVLGERGKRADERRRRDALEQFRRVEGVRVDVRVDEDRPAGRRRVVLSEPGERARHRVLEGLPRLRSPLAVGRPEHLDHEADRVREPGRVAHL